MKKIPDAIFVVDPKRENSRTEAHTPVSSADRYRDTNCDPEELDYVILQRRCNPCRKTDRFPRWQTLLSRQNQGAEEEVYEGTDEETEEALAEE